MQMELLKYILNHNAIKYNCIDLNSEKYKSSVKIPKIFLANTILMKCTQGLVLAFYPASHEFKVEKLKKVLCKTLDIAHPEIESILLKNARLGKMLPLNKQGGLNILIDEALYEIDSVYITDDDNEKAYLLDIEQLNKLASDQLIGTSFSESLNNNNNKEEMISIMDLKSRVKAIHSLPPMPETASQILMLRAKPDVNVERIVEVISQDPILVAQIIRYANSAFFGQTGSVKSLKDAIFRVLGVDAVMNMALALSIGRSFNIPRNGPIGARALWQSSVYTASLMQRMTMLMPWGKRPNPGVAYLVGLLHDIGLMVIGHLFPEEFENLNNYLSEHPDEHILKVEEKLLGITHTEIGKMTMRMWNMPEELITAVSQHHNHNFEDDHSEYVKLLILVESLLAPHGLSYGSTEGELPVAVLNGLELDEEEVIMAADEVLQEGEVIKNLAKEMCA